MSRPAAPTYIEDFPAPALAGPAFLHRPIRLSPDGDLLDPGWNVESGHFRIAELMVRAAQGDDFVETEFERAIADGRAADDAARDWRRRWAASLAENPWIQYALDPDSGGSPDELYRLAGLTVAEQIAMQAWTKLTDDGEFRSTRDVARELKEAESTIRTRLERAVTRLREMRHVAAVA